MVEQQAGVELLWAQTDPKQSIEIGIAAGYRDPSTSQLVTSYESFFKYLSEPDPELHEKDGPQFLIGPCRGRRSNQNIPHGVVFVLDADKSLDERKMEVDGAPDPIAVHEALKGWGISHCLYTTFSHGKKGNRYRVIFPYLSSNREHLRAMAVYITEILQKHAGLQIALSRESYVWGQGWALPRVPYEGADFEFYSHMGNQPDAETLLASYPSQTQKQMPAGLHDGFIDEHSPIGLVDKCLPIQWQLADKGYTYINQGTMLDSEGVEVPVLRYRKPESTSAPGVAVFFSRGRWRVYSHHTNDPLANGHSNDAFDTYQLLNGFTDHSSAMLSLVPTLQEYVEDMLNEEYPSVLEGGVKFRYGNKYIDEFGSISYRMLEQAAFTALMRNSPGVPSLHMDGDGVKHLKMQNKAEYWLSCPRRTMYNGLTYQPGPIMEEPKDVILKGGKHYFNTFRTWHTKPKKGAWPLLEWHLKNTICGGIESEYKYLLDWFSHLFQYPDEKPGVALVLQGGRGWGKTILFSEIARKLGTHAFIVGNNRLLTGNFNSHMRNRLMLIVEESFWAGNHKERGVLQHVISDEITGYEKKGFDAEAGRSFIRVVLISNDEWVVPAAKDARRYFIPTVSAASKEADIVDGVKGYFFPRLLNELRNGGLDAFIHDMAVRELDRQSVRTVPQTERLLEQKELSLDWLDRWFMETLLDKAIKAPSGTAPWMETGCIVSSDLLKDSLKSYAAIGSLYSDKGVITAFGVRVKKMFGRALCRRMNGHEGLRYVLGPLSVCRQSFEEYAEIPVDWGEDQAPPATEEMQHGLRH